MSFQDDFRATISTKNGCTGSLKVTNDHITDANSLKSTQQSLEQYLVSQANAAFASVCSCNAKTAQYNAETRVISRTCNDDGGVDELVPGGGTPEF